MAIKESELIPKEKQGKLRKIFMNKHYLLILIALLVILAILIISDFSLINFNDKEILQDICGDSTPYGLCSLNKPYYCGEGVLVERAEICGCPDILYKNESSCVSRYKQNSKEINLNYFLGENKNSINFLVYSDLIDYISDLPFTISYGENEIPSRVDFKLRNINNDIQRELLLPLVVEIQNLEDNSLDQMRLAVSLVQNIKYQGSNKTISLGDQEINYSRYPYEVLYEEMGICGEKTELLAFLLKELGYETAFFYYVEENHEAVGIKCPEKFGVGDSGYCFIETTGPSIISDSSIVYFDGTVLKSDPEVYLISEGQSLPENIPEYKDAKLMKRLREGKFVFFKKSKLEDLSEKYGLVEEYRLD